MNAPLLIPEPPLQLLRSLAKAVGLSEAIVLQQVYYRELASDTGWVRRAYRDWARHDFPFWDPRTVERVFKRLRDKGLLDVDEPADGSMDRTLAYRVNMAAIPQQRGRQNAVMHPGALPRQSAVMSNKKEERSSPNGEDAHLSDQTREIFDYWKKVHGKNGNAKLGAKRKRAITARLKEGRTVEFLKTAIDGNARSEWHRQQGRHELALVMRDEEHVEDFEARAHGGQLTDHQKQVAEAVARGPSMDEAAVQAQLEEIGLA